MGGGRGAEKGVAMQRGGGRDAGGREGQEGWRAGIGGERQGKSRCQKLEQSQDAAVQPREAKHGTMSQGGYLNNGKPK